MNRTTALFLCVYLGAMGVFAGVFSWLWHVWEQAPAIFYRPWQLTALLTAVFGFSFAFGFPRAGAADSGLRRYVTGAFLRGAGVLAVVLPAAYLRIETVGDRIALVLCVLCIYLLSMALYLAWAARTVGRR